MSLKAMIWVMESAPVTSHAELAVLYALADRAADDGTAAFPAQTWIAERARCSVRTVKRHLKNLEDAGIIHRGDQRHVSYVRGDRRPIVWNLDLTLTRDATGGQNDTPSPPERGDNMTPREGERGVRNGQTGCQSRSNEVSEMVERGDTAVAYEPSLTPLKPSFNRGGDQGREESLRSVPREIDSPPPEISPASVSPAAAVHDAPHLGPDFPGLLAEWLVDPRRARCAVHVDIPNPPPCRQCGDLRRAAEGARARQKVAQVDAAKARQAAIDACDECGPTGWVGDGRGKVMRCSHDTATNDRLRSEVSA